MFPQEIESNKQKDIKNPQSFAIPILKKYQEERPGMPKNELLIAQFGIAMASLKADWGPFIKERENEEAVKDYLDTVIQLLKETSNETSKSYLSQPLISVLRNIKEVDEGEETYNEYIFKVRELCMEDEDLNGLDTFITSGETTD